MVLGCQECCDFDGTILWVEGIRPWVAGLISSGVTGSASRGREAPKQEPCKWVWVQISLDLMVKTMVSVDFPLPYTNPMKIESWIAETLFTCDVATRCVPAGLSAQGQHQNTAGCCQWKHDKWMAHPQGFLEGKWNMVGWCWCKTFWIDFDCRCRRRLPADCGRRGARWLCLQVICCIVFFVSSPALAASQPVFAGTTVYKYSWNTVNDVNEYILQGALIEICLTMCFVAVACPALSFACLGEAVPHWG